MNATKLIVIISLLLEFLFSSAVYGFSLEKGARMAVMWQVPLDVSDNDLELMKKKGINVIQSFNTDSWKDEEVKRYLDKAQKHGLGVIVSVDSFSKKQREEYILDSQKMSAFIKKWKDHPAVFAWHTFDEASAKEREVPHPFQERVKSYVKELSPSTKVMISWNGTTDEHYKRSFSERAFDLLDIHAYVQDVPARRQQALIDQLKKHKKGEYPVLITLRVFNGEKFPVLPADGLKKQYEFFFGRGRITDNIGFYGWKLSRNKGISDDADMMRQFMALDFQK
jgi:hypothetical protein